METLLMIFATFAKKIGAFIFAETFGSAMAYVQNLWSLIAPFLTGAEPLYEVAGFSITFPGVLLGFAGYILLKYGLRLVVNGIFKFMYWVKPPTEPERGHTNVAGNQFALIKRSKEEIDALNEAAALFAEGEWSEAAKRLAQGYSNGCAPTGVMIDDIEEAGYEIGPDHTVRLFVERYQQPNSICIEIDAVNGQLQIGKTDWVFVVEATDQFGSVDRYIVNTGARIQSANNKESIPFTVKRVPTERDMWFESVAETAGVELTPEKMSWLEENFILPTRGEDERPYLPANSLICWFTDHPEDWFVRGVPERKKKLTKKTKAKKVVNEKKAKHTSSQENGDANGKTKQEKVVWQQVTVPEDEVSSNGKSNNPEIELVAAEGNNHIGK